MQNFTMPLRGEQRVTPSPFPAGEGQWAGAACSEAKPRGLAARLVRSSLLSIVLYLPGQEKTPETHGPGKKINPCPISDTSRFSIYTCLWQAPGDCGLLGLLSPSATARMAYHSQTQFSRGNILSVQEATNLKSSCLLSRASPEGASEHPCPASF